MSTRRLALQRETLTALATDELALVVAAGVAEHTIPDRYCIGELLDRYIGQSGGGCF
jgi:hypothetical protein